MQNRRRYEDLNEITAIKVQANYSKHGDDVSFGLTANADQIYSKNLTRACRSVPISVRSIFRGFGLHNMESKNKNNMVTLSTLTYLLVSAASNRMPHYCEEVWHM